MNCYEQWSIFINVLIAIGTISAVIVALFGNRIQNKIFRPKLSVVVLDGKGDLTKFTNGSRVIYYHLRFINEKKSVTIKNCKVYLKKILKRGADNNYHNVPLPVPTKFCWAGRSDKNETVDIVTEQVLDFGFIIENDIEFKPVVEPIFNNFKGFLKQGESIRYQLEIIADNYRPKGLITIETSWNGNWSDNLSIMESNFIIKKI